MQAGCWPNGVLGLLRCCCHIPCASLRSADASNGRDSENIKRKTMWGKCREHGCVACVRVGVCAAARSPKLLLQLVKAWGRPQQALGRRSQNQAKPAAQAAPQLAASRVLRRGGRRGVALPPPCQRAERAERPVKHPEGFCVVLGVLGVVAVSAKARARTCRCGGVSYADGAPGTGRTLLLYHAVYTL